jgi:16S rRNA processing protein RimM
LTAERRFADLVAIGRVVRPQGRKGEVLAKPLSDRPDRFPGLRKAYVPGPGDGSRRVDVESCWPHKGSFVLKLEGVDSIDAAEAYRGLELRIGEEELQPLPEGSYYHHQLRGLRVEEKGSGRSLGSVADILETGGAAVVLVVRGPAGESLIPLAAPFVERVELAAGRLLVTPLAEETVPATGGAR